MEKKSRDSSIELLRILCMLMVVATHYAGGWAHREIPFYNGDNLVNCIIYCMLGQWGRIGVNIFVIISSFFLVDSKFRFKRILKLILQVFIYSISFYIFIGLIYNKSAFSIIELFKACFPIMTQMYWFITPYIILSLMSPFLNILIKNMGQKRHLACTLVLFLLSVALPNISLDRLPIPFTYLGLFIAIYLLVAYIKIYPIKILESLKASIIIFVGLSIIITCWTVGWLCLAKKINIFHKGIAYSTYLTRINNIVAILFSLVLFNIFRFVKIKSNVIINTIASGTFGVYIIHCNPYVSDIIWYKILKIQNYLFANPLSLIGNFVYSVLVVFFVCVVIDLARKYLLEIPFFKIIDKPYNKIEKFAKGLFDKGIIALGVNKQKGE